MYGKENFVSQDFTNDAFWIKIRRKNQFLMERKTIKKFVRRIQKIKTHKIQRFYFGYLVAGKIKIHEILNQ